MMKSLKLAELSRELLFKGVDYLFEQKNSEKIRQMIEKTDVQVFEISYFHSVMFDDSCIFLKTSLGEYYIVKKHAQRCIRECRRSDLFR